MTGASPHNVRWNVIWTVMKIRQKFLCWNFFCTLLDKSFCSASSLDWTVSTNPICFRQLYYLISYSHKLVCWMSVHRSAYTYYIREPLSHGIQKAIIHHFDSRTISTKMDNFHKFWGDIYFSTAINLGHFKLGCWPGNKSNCSTVFYLQLPKYLFIFTFNYPFLQNILFVRKHSLWIRSP